MKSRRYKDKDWSEAYNRHLDWMRAMIGKHGDQSAPPVLVAMRAKQLMEAHYRGPWRMMWALLKDQFWSLWLHYGFNRWEWIRTRIFRLPKDEALAAVDRVGEEEAEIQELADKL